MQINAASLMRAANDVVRQELRSNTLRLVASEIDLLKRLAELHRKRVREARRFYDYYRTEHDPPVIRANYSEAYQLLLKLSRNPLARLVVEAMAERLAVVGVSLGNDALNQVAWNIWQRNHMDERQNLVHRDALVTGVGWVSIWPDNGEAKIMPEQSTQITGLFSDSAHLGTPEAALKVWVHGDKAYADLYTEEAIFKYESTNPEVSLLTDPNLNGAGSWTERTDPVANPFAEIPLVPFHNRQAIGPGYSEISDLIPIIRRIDKLTLDMMLASEVGAFMQRYIIGATPPKDADGNPTAPVKAGADRLWMIEDPEAKIGQLQPTALDGFLKAIDAQVAMLAAVSRVPAHYLYSTSLANPPSAESLRASEAGLLNKVEDRQLAYGESWEKVMSLALEAEDIEDDIPDSMEMVWQDPEVHSPAAQADAALKWREVGVPNKLIWQEVLGMSPQQADAVERQILQERLRAQAEGSRLGLDEQQVDTDLVDAQAVKTRAEAMQLLISQGVDPKEAARVAGVNVRFLQNPANSVDVDNNEEVPTQTEG